VRRWIDPAAVAAISLGAWVVSRPWPGFNSPDSEFYASLALFGSEVTDRALEPGYAWTRLGYIAPVRSLTSALGPWAGFGVWRYLVIAMVVGSVYAVVRMASTRQLAALLATLAGLNTMVLAYAGNTYLTGTVVGALSVLLALGCWHLLRPARLVWLPALLSGVVVGWLVMINPYGALLGLAMWLSLRAVGLARDRSLIHVGRDALAAAAGFVASFVILLLAGLLIFPGRNWFSTYLQWNSALDYASFIGDATTWQRDTALLVPVMALLICAGAWLLGLRPPGNPALLGTVIAGANLAFTAVYLVLVPGPWLEAPTYVAKLWAGALIAIGLACAAIVRDRSLGWAGWLAVGVLALLAIWAGRWETPIGMWVGVGICLVALALFIATTLVLRRGGLGVIPAWSAAVACLSVAGLLIGAQILQNGRGLLGTYGQYPLRAAYVDYEGELLMTSKVQAQQWILDQTKPGERIGIWTDPDRLMAPVAGMQLWGWYNNVLAGDVLGRTEAETLAQLAPDAIAMYAPERSQIEAFYASLPPWSMPSPLECITVPFRGVGNVNPSVCLTRLTWLR